MRSSMQGVQPCQNVWNSGLRQSKMIPLQWLGLGRLARDGCKAAALASNTVDDSPLHYLPSCPRRRYRLCPGLRTTRGWCPSYKSARHSRFPGISTFIFLLSPPSNLTLSFPLMKTMSTGLRISDEQWESHKAEIVRMYINDDLSLEKVKATMAERYSFGPR